ncbi:MAG TPA: Ni/Fe hydrogenase subunit alpha, partial [Armatimonadota bacterium]
MASTITIDPVTRIEGHAKITLFMDDSGEVQDAQFHVTQVRGFEKLSEGRPFYEMPSLMARICGICPVSHLMASAKACDALLAVQIPETGQKLRRLMNLAQMVQSHALSFFHLSSPDLLLGMDADPVERNLLGVVAKHPELAKDGIALRRFGQHTIEILGGKRVHPAWVVPGGVSEPLATEQKDEILAGIPQALAIAQRTLNWFKRAVDNYGEEIRTFANFPSHFMGLVSPQGGIEFYDGPLRIVDSTGAVVADGLKHDDYASFIGEAAEPFTFLKFTYYKPEGYPQGLYRVG